MTAPQEAQKDRQYRLRYEPDGRSWTVRENLVDLLERELLGPANGPKEVLDAQPDIAYLIGRIAPVRLTAGREDPKDADTAEAATDVGDALDAEESRGVPVTAVEESGAGADEDSAEDEPQKRGLMIPASMGLRCQVPTDVADVMVTASWGVYEPVKEKGEEGKQTLRRYKRTPVEIPTKIVIADLVPGKTTTIPLKDKVVLRVDRHDDAERGCRLVEIALCNDQVTPRKIPVSAWLYQTKLLIEAGGADVFLPVVDPLADTRPERDDELRRLRLQYRDRLEFAVGRTCSVDWDADEGARRARTVWTTWLPTCQTPQTTAEEIGTALLDMTELAKASDEELRAGLEPIVNEYAAWLDGQRQEAEALPAHLREEGLDAVREAGKVQQQLTEGLDHLLGDPEALRCFQFMNRVMADQRIQSQVAQRRAKDPKESVEQARAAVLAEGSKAHSWRTFQLAFVLMQLPLLSDPAAPRRSGDLAGVSRLGDRPACQPLRCLAFRP